MSRLMIGAFAVSMLLQSAASAATVTITAAGIFGPDTIPCNGSADFRLVIQGTGPRDTEPKNLEYEIRDNDNPLPTDLLRLQQFFPQLLTAQETLK